MAETTLPALDGDDGRARLDDVELERAAKTEPDAVVDLPKARQPPEAASDNSRTWGLLTSVCHWWLSMPRGSGYQNG